jgi:hypothetical protein
MEIDWNAIIWFVIWAAVALVSVGLVIWIVVAAVAARHIKAVRADFDKGFDSDFFKNNRLRR